MAKEFEEIVKEEILNEMPYINTTGEEYFDLELEKYKDDFSGFLTKIKSIVMGIQYIEPTHNTKIELSTSDEVDKFINQLKENKMVMLYVWNEFIKWLKQYKLKGRLSE
jgi:hypothetical protein